MAYSLLAASGRCLGLDTYEDTPPFFICQSTTFDNTSKSFQFKAVYAAKLEEEDWNFSGRSATSRRTITASVNKVGVAKMKANWVYQDLDK
jgi:hypothetical protein